MQLIKPFIHIILFLLSATIVELTSSKIWFQGFVKNVASKFHKNWRQHFFSEENPFIKNCFKLTNNGTHYNSSDFIYPMILGVGSCLVHRSLKVAHACYNSSIAYVDLLNMDYDELPGDWSYENRATA
ncbi:unnamed protein product [Rotaria socialis]|uniref:Uncharacterized protein n=1 Tax=Rotaria socialis TaxID=392032 RepID=A0A817U2J5_9BILA|nr:unnamed protein product [Rotaria socialis]CAF3412357.1 unnamed protein product [Rotaria socialis]CAF3418552.1 unnamed protein product [Rotaria socialis]CAF3635185.1 unnamed protein product [Rotaria socialis]CAF3757007.1 unnamed protein product [Rotaria socialis]